MSEFVYLFGGIGENGLLVMELGECEETGTRKDTGVAVPGFNFPIPSDRASALAPSAGQLSVDQAGGL